MQLPPDTQTEELTSRGRTLFKQGHVRQAQPLLEQALACWQQAHNLAGATQTLQLLALVAQRSHVPRLAQEYLLQAIQYSRELNDRPQEAALLADLGSVVAGVGEIESAISYYSCPPSFVNCLACTGKGDAADLFTNHVGSLYSQARQLYQDLLNRAGEGLALFAIGKAHQEAGNIQAATPLFRAAFPLLRGTDSWTEEVAQMEQLVDTLSVAQDGFGLLGGLGKSKPATLDAIADRLSTQAAAGSHTAARLFDTFSSMMASASDFLQARSPEHRLQRNLTALTDPDPKKRCEAARELATYTPRVACESLFNTLDQEHDPAIQQAIIQTLGAYGDPTFVERLRPLLQDRTASVRLATVIALVALGESGLEQQLLDGLNAQDSKLRAQVIQLLEKLGDSAIGDVLLPMVQDCNPKVRSKAIYALGTLRDLRAVDPLIAATQDRYQVVRWAAVRVLGDFGDKRAVDALIAGLYDSNRDVRRSAATALGKLKDSRAADALTVASTDDWWGVRESAQAALRKLKAKPSLAPLLAQLRNPNGSIRRSAVELLASQDREAAIPVLREQLSDQDPWVRLAAIKALAELKDQQSVPAMLAELAQDNSVIQIELIETLGKLGDARVAPALVTALKHRNPYIRFACIQALGEVGTREDLPALAAIQLHDEAR